MPRQPGETGAKPLHVSLVAIPEAVVSTLWGIFDVMNAFAILPPLREERRQPSPFEVEIVGLETGPLNLASNVPVTVQRSIDTLDRTDIVIVPSILLSSDGWRNNRHPELVEWFRAMHRRGALLCSACSGIFLLAETGLFDGVDATVHFGYARGFADAFPKVPVHPERVLVVSGFALQWHQDGLAPYIVFEGRNDHGDAAVEKAQGWVATHFPVTNPLEEMVRLTGLTERTFKRRFTAATGFSPIAYVQRLRIEEAKRRLERTEASVDEISWQVGYEEPAFFRRLFKRVTGMTPGAYRRRFRIPDYALPKAGR